MLQSKYLTVVFYAMSVSVCYGVYCGGNYCSTGGCCTKHVWESYCCEESTTFYPDFSGEAPSTSFPSGSPAKTIVLLAIGVVFFMGVIVFICTCVSKSGQVSASDSTNQETSGSDSTNHTSTTSGNTESSGGLFGWFSNNGHSSFGSSSNQDSGFGFSSDSHFGSSSNNDHGISSFGDSD
ncbi:hypothetical protein SNE40_013945 [Patella caerulea]|uniref:Uncharacterized protein n=1 Tax=Patella caerulea TaxID=87958 RepID=A0AAN8JCK7_PATCE